MKRAIILPAILMMTGCVAVWGAPYQIEHQNESSIKMRFDTTFTDLDKVRAIAQQHCDQYKKTAEIQSQHKSIWGLTTVDFTCKDKP